jgi:GT2 family glycosyltransferase
LLAGDNVGFSKGNNRAKPYTHGKMVLFLNPDTVLNEGVLAKTIGYLKTHKDVGVVTCKLVLPSGELDKDARRSYPTPWVSLTHLVLKLDRLFPKSKLFARYWYGYIPDDVTHEVESVEGTFLLTRREILDQVNWFDEDYFFNAEDIDLCWKIHEKGWKLIYYPEVFIYHIKGASKGKSKIWRHKVSFAHRLKMRLIEITSMEIFYRKHYWKKYPLFLNYLVILGIRFFKLVRFMEVVTQSI